ncbi:Gar1/Naf1 RNA binding region-domain-containing protein [Xylaria palmicola]|nr:Gar1/Naf1 RNA binding region-domain-containing protein [Xylaria palmicola]
MSGLHIPGLSMEQPAAPSTEAPSAPASDDVAAKEEPQPTTTGGAESGDEAPQLTTIDSANPQDAALEAVGDEMMVDSPPSPPSLISGLEALLGGLDPQPEPAHTPSDPNRTAAVNTLGESNALSTGPNTVAQPRESVGGDNGDMDEENPGWEVDSSPYESSSDSSSSDDSDDDSDDEKDYKILGPEETARILMEMDGGSDDEGDGKGKGGGSGMVRTKNEIPEAIIPRPDVEIKPEMEIAELGVIEHFVDNTAVIRANVSGEYQVLDTGSVLCLEDRTVIAALADVIATVREPRYTAGFASEEEIKSFGLEIGTKIFYPPTHANLGLTQVLKANKGTDASNWHDEEVADDEIEFSDDEKEAEHKRQLKAKKRGARGGRDGAASQGGRNDPLTKPPATAGGLNYDDDEDGPYRPLARPSGYGQSQSPHGGNEPPTGASAHPGSGVNRRGDFRGRGGRGRAARGNRGGNSRGGHSLPPRPQAQGGQGGQGTHNFQQQPAQLFNMSASPFAMSGQPGPVFPPPQQSSQPPYQQPNQQFPFVWPQNPQAVFYPPPPPQFTGQQGTNEMQFSPQLLAALQNQIQNQQIQNNNQWTGGSSQYNNQQSGQGGHG